MNEQILEVLLPQNTEDVVQRAARIRRDFCKKATVLVTHRVEVLFFEDDVIFASSFVRRLHPSCRGSRRDSMCVGPEHDVERLPCRNASLR